MLCRGQLLSALCFLFMYEREGVSCISLLSHFLRDFCATCFRLPEGKIPGKGHFIDLSNEYKFVYVPISSEKSDY